MLEDRLYPFLDVYQRLPASLQSFCGHLFRLLPENLRLGPQYKISCLEAVASRTLSSSDIDEVRNRKLELVLDEAFQYVPFYQNLYTEYGVKRKNIQTVDDLKYLPIISKADVRNNTSAFISTRQSKNLVKMNSGGSTGAPLSFFLQKGVSRAKERAYFDTYWADCGYLEGKTPLARLTGLRLPDPIISRYEPIRNTLVCSSYDLDRKGAISIANKISKFGAKFILGYSSTLHQFATILKRYNLASPSHLQGIFSSSEPLYPFMRTTLESVFNAPVYDWYGHSERLILAPRFNLSEGFCSYPLYGHLECIDSASKETSGSRGKIVGTGFDNLAFPLIRYNTDDHALFGGLSENHKSLNWKVLKSIEGRSIDFLIDDENKPISITAIIYGQHLNAFSTIQKMQIYQATPGFIEIRIVPSAAFGGSEEKEILNKILEISKGKIQATIVLKSEIEPLLNGKFKFLIQESSSNPIFNSDINE